MTVLLYSGDLPNPALNEFAMAHAKERPYRQGLGHDDTGAFRHTIRTTKQTPIFSLHGYHLGKKPHDAIRSYIAHFTTEGDLVLDPFCGSGSTALAASMERRKAIGIDASPAATFIARYYLAEVDPKEFEARFRTWIGKVRDELGWLYGTTCHRCRGPAILHHLVYSNTYGCPCCGAVVSLFEALRFGGFSRKGRCPHCEEGLISTKLPVLGFLPVASSFSCLGSCKPRRCTRSMGGTKEEAWAFEHIDLRSIEALEREPIPYPVPDVRMMNEQSDSVPWGDEWRPSRNFRTLRELFTHRNLWALAALKSAAGSDLDLQGLLTSSMFAVSRKSQHLDRGGGYIPGNWALPPMSKQRNVLETLSKVFRRSQKARIQLADADMERSVCLSTQSATDLSAIPNDSVDYIFTDPPYGGTVQYGELNFLWEAWLGFDTGWHEREIVVNRVRGKTLEAWQRDMTRVFCECHRVLKPGRWLSICYHDACGESWNALGQAVKDAGFVNESLSESVAIDTGGRTYNQHTVDMATKRDLVFNFRKPRDVGMAFSVDDGVRSEARFDGIVMDYLEAHPGATKDMIYDDFIAKTFCHGVVRRADFDEILSRVGVMDGGLGRMVTRGRRKGNRAARWFLRRV
jgi:DNA modification methylase